MVFVVAVIIQTILVVVSKQQTLAVETNWQQQNSNEPNPQILVQELSPDDIVNWKNDNIIDWKNDITDTDTEDINVDTKNKGSIPLQVGPGPGVEVPISNEYEDDNKPIPIKSVDAVVNGNAELPCDIQPADPNDEVYLVLWYKDLAGKPLYSFDVRSRNPNDAVHWSDDQYFGKRAHFRIGSDSTVLLITKVQIEEEGVYRCRVDYRNSPTRNLKVNLTVVVQPSSPRIWSPDKKIDTSGAIAGIYDEGDNMDLRCTTVGGRPPPSLTWWIDGSLVDSKYFYEGADTVVNKLTHMKAERKYDGATLECRASNNNVSHAPSRMVEIKINLRPEKVEIIQKPTSVIVGREYQLVCQAHGSKPPPTFTWYKNRKLVDQKWIVTHVQDGSQIASSVYTIVPEQLDDQREITCKAENPQIRGKAVEDTMVLSVMYPPSVQLRMGPSIQPNDIKEGGDVYFECNAHSNPPITKLEWIHNDKILYHKMDSGIILSNFSLVIQNVRRDHAGTYLCVATNSHGNGSSNPVQLNVLYPPTCDNLTNRKAYGIAPGGNMMVPCHLEANPPVDSFRWWFSTSGKTTEIHSSKIIKTNSSVSLINYTAETESDYGTLSCLGYNRIGSQSRPCSFTINPASHPYPPENCTIKDGPKIEMQLVCTPNYNGGLKQSFVLEIYETVKRRLKENLTSEDYPQFNLSKLRGEQPLQFEIYARNLRGASEKVIITNVRVNPPEKRTDPLPIPGREPHGNLHLPLWISALVSLLVVLIVVTVVILKKRQELSLHLGDCKGKCHLTSSASTENPMDESTANPEPANPNNQAKEADPLWPEAEWSHTPSTHATRCVTFSDGNHNRNHDIITPKNIPLYEPQSVPLYDSSQNKNVPMFEPGPSSNKTIYEGTMTSSVPSHSTSPPPYHHFAVGQAQPQAGNSQRFQGNYYQNPLDQEYAKVPRHQAVQQASYTLDRGYSPDQHYTMRPGQLSYSHVTFNTQPRRPGGSRIQLP